MPSLAPRAAPRAAAPALDGVANPTADACEVEELRALLDHTEKLLCRTDAAGRLTFVNAAWQRTLGYTAAEAAALAPVDLVAPEDRGRYLAAARRLVTGAPVRDFEAALLTKDGRRIACRGWAVPRMAPGPDGRPACVGTYAGYRDVTAERRTEAVRARLAATLDASPDFVALVEAGGRVAYLNRAGRHLVGLPEDADASVVHMSDLHPVREHARLQVEVIPAARRAGIWAGETVLLGAGGEEIPVSQVLVAHPAAHAGEPSLLSVVARDLRDRVAAERALAASEARFRALSATSPLGVYHAQPDGVVTYVNPRMAALWRTAPDALLGLAWLDCVHADDVDALLTGWRDANAAGADFVHEFRIRVPAGGPDEHANVETRWMRGRSAVIAATDGRPAGVVGTVEDVTVRVTQEVVARRLTSILEASPDVVVIATPEGRLDYVNASGRRLLGLAGAPEAVPAAGLTVAAVQPQLAPGGPMADAVASATRDGVWRGETVLRKCDGREIPVEQVLVAHAGADGTVDYLSATLRDITERKQHEATLRTLALVDELTGLYNRRGFLALAEPEFQRATAAGQGVIVLYADLDAFKAVNDTYGHAAGDRALAAVATVLRRTVREADVLARLGGDEFVVLARCGAGQEPAAVGARLLARLAAELADANARAAAAGSRPYALALSAGVAHMGSARTAAPAADPRPDSLAALMTAADGALYDQKLARKQSGAASG